MRKIIIFDVSGKVELYDGALYDALKEQLVGNDLELLFPQKGLVCLIPSKYKNSEHILKRLIKVVEGIVNYIILLCQIAFQNVGILHFQWLPFLDYVSWEILLIKLIRFISPSTKIILTIHNVYPHNMTDIKKESYNKRFRIVCKLIDEFIVHTQISKDEVVREFNLPKEKVNVCYHGVFIPKLPYYDKKYKKNSNKLRILQFGGQSYYKGTDILVQAINLLTLDQREKIETHIVGGVSQQFLSELKALDISNAITWKPYFLPEEELNQEIIDADIIVLPYRAISQSGVLLLSIFFGKIILCSNLPSFIETMRGNENNALDDYLFFETENSESLMNLLSKYIDKSIDTAAIYQRMIYLNTLYSWESAATSTIKVYKK